MMENPLDVKSKKRKTKGQAYSMPKSLTSPGLDDYLKRAKVLGIIPNFWLTKEYLSTQNITPRSNGKVIWLEEDDWAIFPPLPLWGKLRDVSLDSPTLRVWSDFENFTIGEPLEFLDWEYTYDAYNFQVMKGKRWAVFRKNSRKWQKDKKWEYKPLLPGGNNKQAEALLVKWLESKPEEEIHDQESMLHFVLKGSLRGFLFDKDKLVGVNAWDWNELHRTFLMYRYCVTDPDEPFLNEFARLLFYQSMPGWLVIDGGCLGNPGLERFKDKLNPVKKRAIYSKIIRR